MVDATCVSCQNKSDHLIFKLLDLLFQKQRTQTISAQSPGSEPLSSRTVISISIIYGAI